MDDTTEMYEGFNTILPGQSESIHNKMIETIAQILISGSLKKEYIIRLLKNPKVIATYERAFTHQSYDATNNYEYFEFLGDGTVNNSVIWYIGRKFPEYHEPGPNHGNPVEVFSRTKISLISKHALPDFAKDFGFWDFIRCSKEERQTDMKDLLEDSFEAFIGATQLVIDEFIGMGAGYAICYNIIAEILDQNERIIKYIERRQQGLPAVDYYDVCDSVTILKQTMEDRTLTQMQHIGRIIPNPKVNTPRELANILKPANYVTKREEVEINGKLFPQVTIEYWLQRGHFERGQGKSQPRYINFIPDHRYQIILIGQGTAFDQDKAQRAASEMALTTLARLGLSKPIPESYLCTGVRK